MSYRLRLYQYSGGYFDLIADGELWEVRRAAFRAIRRHMNVMEYPVSILEKGRKWELETGDDANMIGDEEGVLKIEEIIANSVPDDEETDEFDEDRCEECGEYESCCTCEEDDEDE